MAVRPDVKPHDWIQVENVPCVVAVMPEPTNPSSDIEVVFGREKPANVMVKWTGNNWVFAQPNDLGGYADRYSRLSPFVRTLKAGPYAR
jgi:hypothetical protein